MLTFVDANVFMRFFVQDDPKQAAVAEKFLQQAQQGKIDLITGPPVFFELAWTLRFAYKIGNRQILDILEAILAFGGLKVIDKDLVTEAIFLARETNSEFADTYIACSAKSAQAQNIATFNIKHFKNFNVELYPL